MPNKKETNTQKIASNCNINPPNCAALLNTNQKEIEMISSRGMPNLLLILLIPKCLYFGLRKAPLG